MSLTLMSGLILFSMKVLLGLELPTTDPGGRPASGNLETSESLWGPLFRVALIEIPSGILEGRSLALCTATSILPSRRASLRLETKTPLLLNPERGVL